MKIKVIGIDLAKSVFQVCALQTDKKVLFNKKVKRASLMSTVRQFEPGTLIALEACSTSHYWGRIFQEMGFDVKLIPPQHVKPFVKVQKNDANDAIAICEAALRPNIHFVQVKTVNQQDLCALHTVRQGLIQKRTAQGNQIRALALEYGISFPQSIRQLTSQLPLELENAENSLTVVSRRLLSRMLETLIRVIDEVDQLEEEIKNLGETHDNWNALQSVPGIGPIVASALLGQVGNGCQFKNGRQMAAWIGLVPKQKSSVGRTKLGGITKNGNRYLRYLFMEPAQF